MATTTRTVEVELATPTLGANGAITQVPLTATPGGVVMPVDLAPGQEPDMGSERMLINIGPQHPATHGVLRLVLELDGETVIRCVPHIGYLHCGFEKIGEYRQYNQIIPWTDREDYLNSMGNNIAYALSAERLFGIEVTPRCTVLRVIAMELSRIISHLVWLGTTAIDMGAFTPFLWTFQERETVYNLWESWVGARLTTSASRIGGMAADLPTGWIDGLKGFLRSLPRTLDETDRMLTRNGIWVGRTVGLGVMSASEATNYGLSGPMLRASGVAYDVRKDFPYLDYETYDWDIAVGTRGDVYDRYLVRMEEMRQSVRIIEQALERLPDGPINVDDPRVILPDKSKATSEMESMIHHFKLVMEGPRPPAGECYVATESPKGEKGYYIVSDGTAKPSRWRIRPPAFVNLSAISKMAEGHLLSDVIAINASIDIVMGEIDR
ncbi:MAG: NADH dehydrogenase (quinone) subunit D [Gemmatimonadota bacterium]